MKNYFFPAMISIAILFVACQPKDRADHDASDDTTATGTSTGVSGTYVIDPQASEVKWRGFKPTGIHNGTINVTSGSVSVSDGAITGGRIEIDMKSITVLDLQGENKMKLEGHLKGSNPGSEQDFFDTNKYPTATYVINSTQPLSNDPDGTHMINGTLSIKDISKPVNFKAKVNLTDNKLTAITPEFDVDRTEFDIRFKSRKFFNNLQDDFINDEFKLQISVVANKR